MKSKYFKQLLIALGALMALFGSVNLSNAALIIVGQAASTASLADSTGAVLVSSDAVEIGWYTSAPTTPTFVGYTSVSQFLGGWNTVAVGGAEAFDLSGLALVSTELADGDNSLKDKQMYLIAGNGSLLSTSTELFIITSSSWIVPDNVSGVTPVSFSFDVSDPGTEVLWGTFFPGGGITYYDGTLEENVTMDAFRTQAVPEPSTGALIMIGAVGLVALRRLRKV